MFLVLDITEKLELLNSIPIIGQSVWEEIRNDILKKTNKSQYYFIADSLDKSILATEDLNDALTKLNDQSNIQPHVEHDTDQRAVAW